MYPETLYEAPAGWGDACVADRATMLALIEQLRALGDEWERCELNDCPTYSLVLPESGVYELDHTRQMLYYRAIADGDMWMFDELDIDDNDYPVYVLRTDHGGLWHVEAKIFDHPGDAHMAAESFVRQITDAERVDAAIISLGRDKRVRVGILNISLVCMARSAAEAFQGIGG